MNEVYWITRLDSLETLFGFLVLFSVIGAICFVIGKLALNSYEGNSCYEEEEKNSRFAIKCGKWLMPLIFLGIPGCVFVPNTKEGLLIYGVGNTMDYLTSNPHAMNIPDLALEALEEYAKEYIHKKENN